MTHRPIVFEGISLRLSHKICFDAFSAQIQYGQRIGIIGRNGSGKSTLLNIIQGNVEPSSGRVSIPGDVQFGVVPQTIAEYADLSGGQRFNKALTHVLAQNPNVLCLDEPTNHLDANNRRSLMRMLQNYSGTLLVVSHDVELLRTCVDQLWHIDHEKIAIFNASSILVHN